MNKWITILVAIVQGVPAPAAAQDSHYTWLECWAVPVDSGVIETLSLVLDADGTFRVNATGRITPCRPPGPHDAFALVSYSDTEAVGNAVPYTESPFARMRRDATPFDLAAVCLVANNATRLDCHEIIWRDEGNGHWNATANRIPVDHPLVQRTAEVEMSPGDLNPSCASCWGYPEP